MNIQRILCPTDFSDFSAHALEHAATLAGYYRSTITVLHVFDAIEPSVDLALLERLRQATTVAAEPAADESVEVDVRVEVGSPVRQILECASILPADLIVIGTHGAGGFEHLVLGSVTEKVLRRAACPVLTVPPREQGRPHAPFSRILCAVDFSKPSLDGLATALSLAHESKASLTLLHVLEWPWDEPPAPPFQDLPAPQGAALVEFRRYLEASAKRRLDDLVPDTFPASRLTTRLRNGKSHEQILDVASGERSDLIVLGVRGRTVDVAVFGSTANHVVRTATCPVMTIR